MSVLLYLHHVSPISLEKIRRDRKLLEWLFQETEFREWCFWSNKTSEVNDEEELKKILCISEKTPILFQQDLLIIATDWMAAQKLNLGKSWMSIQYYLTGHPDFSEFPEQPPILVEKCRYVNGLTFINALEGRLLYEKDYNSPIFFSPEDIKILDEAFSRLLEEEPIERLEKLNLYRKKAQIPEYWTNISQENIDDFIGLLNEFVSFYRNAAQKSNGILIYP